MSIRQIYSWKRKCLFLSLFLIFVLLGHGAPLYGQIKTEFFQGHKVVAQEVLVKFRPEAQRTIAEAMGRFGSSLDLDNIEGIGGAGWLLFHSRTKDSATLVQELVAHPDVEYAEPNYIVHATDTLPNDPRFGELYGLRNTGQVIQGIQGISGADIKAVQAWDISTRSRSTVVATVDSGIDYNHPDLAPNVWSAPSAFSVVIGSLQINCPASSHGFNALRNTCDPMDDNGHGTHVAGTIGAVGNNRLGVVGVNWAASIMGLKFLDASGQGPISAAINAIRFAVQVKQYFSPGRGANVRVLNNSWMDRGGFSQALLDEINGANANDMLFVASAGNNGSDNDVIPVYPASYNAPNVIAVAATDNRDALAAFPPPFCVPGASNFGRNSVHLGAPGRDILSTLRASSYGYMCGTSMAAPHVSGAASLVLSRCGLNTARLKSNLLDNVDPIPALAGITVTGGRLNVNRAMRGCPINGFAYVVGYRGWPYWGPLAHGYTIDSTTGALTTVPGSPFAAGAGPSSVAVHPTGQFVYVANSVSSSVSAYTINATTGALTPVPGSPFPAGAGSSSVAVHPAGLFVYVANNGSHNVSAYTIDPTTGVLTTVPGSPFAAGAGPSSVAVHPTGQFLYVANQNASNLWAYTINPTTGDLTTVPGSPFVAGSGPSSVAVDPTGQFVYVANNGSHNIWAYTIDPTTGALTTVPGPPFAAGWSPQSVAVDPTGQFVYVANSGSHNVSAFTIDAASGGLTPVPGSPFPTGGVSPNSVAVDPAGQFIYVANSGSNNVSAFTIDAASGGLTPVPGSPFPTGGLSPRSVTTTTGSRALPEEQTGQRLNVP